MPTFAFFLSQAVTHTNLKALRQKLNENYSLILIKKMFPIMPKVHEGAQYGLKHRYTYINILFIRANMEFGKEVGGHNPVCYPESE